jgi:hypothetical protein
VVLVGATCTGQCRTRLLNLAVYFADERLEEKVSFGIMVKRNSFSVLTRT